MLTAKEKILFVKLQIVELAQISPSGAIYLKLHSIPEVDDGPASITIEEQKIILRKLEEDGCIKCLRFDEKRNAAWLEKNEEIPWIALSDIKQAIVEARLRLKENSIPEKISTDYDKIELEKITIVTPTFGNFDYLWIIFNDNHKNKIQRNIKNKQTPSDVSYGKKLYDLAKNQNKTLNYEDKSLTDNLNDSIWNAKFMTIFKKRRILKQENGRIRMADGIELETKSLSELSKQDQHYYPKIVKLS